MIHQYKLNGYNIVLDTYSGAIHTVDDLAYDIISLYKEKSTEEIITSMLEKYKADKTVTREEILSCIEDIKELEKAGKLFSKDIYENRAFDFKNRKTDIKALCLHVAHTCNLNCEYCFASQGKYHGERALMPYEVGKRALDFLIENSGSRHNLEVDFFGGEPLMNFEVVKKLVKYGMSRIFSFFKIYNLKPCKRLPNISKMQASNTIVPVCTMTSFLENSIKFGKAASLMIFLCFTITPLGLPVEPEVYITYIKSSGEIVSPKFVESWFL